MAFTEPVYNQTLSYWIPGHVPTTHARDATTPGQVYLLSKFSLEIEPAINTQWVPPIQVRIPSTSFVTPLTAPLVGGIFGGIEGTYIAYYKVRWWGMMHCGFSNEYLMILCEQCRANGSIPDTNR